MLLKAALGGDPNYDGPFYKERSVINVIDQVDVPAFFIGGEYDLFQRGTPLLFENLRKRGVPAKMIFGPWDHLQGSSGKEIAKAGYGDLGELQLRWFDHWLKDVPDPALDSDIPNLTYFDQGPDTWRTSSDWITDQQATSFRLSGSATNAKPARAHDRRDAGRRVERAAHPGRRAVHPLDEPVDRWRRQRSSVPTIPA